MLFALESYGYCILYELKKPGKNISSFSDFHLITAKPLKQIKNMKKYNGLLQ